MKASQKVSEANSGDPLELPRLKGLFSSVPKSQTDLWTTLRELYDGESLFDKYCVRESRDVPRCLLACKCLCMFCVCVNVCMYMYIVVQTMK